MAANLICSHILRSLTQHHWLRWLIYSNLDATCTLLNQKKKHVGDWIISKKTQDAEFLWVLHEVWILNIKESQASIMHHQAHFQLDPHSSPEFGTARSLVSIHLSLKIHTPRNFKTIGSGTCPSRNITAPSWEGNTFPNIDPVSTFLHLLALAPCGSRICWRSQDLRAVLPFGTRKKPWKNRCFDAETVDQWDGF